MFWRQADGAETVLLTVVASMVMISPLLLLDGGETAREVIEGVFGPIGLLFLPVTLLIFIQFLSSNPSGHFSRFLSGSPDAPSQFNGSPSTGIVLALLIVIVFVLLYTRVFGGGADYED